MNNTHKNIFGVYIHYPVCRRKCGYCDFYSEVRPDFDHKTYVDVILQEMSFRAPDFHSVGSVKSIYFGGGTPSLCPPKKIGQIIDRIKQEFKIADPLEVTVEANPGTVDEFYFEELLEAGVNRLSIGIQSLDDSMLQLLGRVHDSCAARKAVQDALKAGFKNIGCDMIFGMPGQNLHDYLSQLEAIVELGPKHISAYSLSLSSNSPMWKAGLRPVFDDLIAEMMNAGRELLEKHDFVQYEVSNFAQNNKWQCLHNALVWARRPYLGVGACAHSLVMQTGDSDARVANPPLDQYLAGIMDVKENPRCIASAQVEAISPLKAQYEFLFLGLRTVEGISRSGFLDLFGYDFFEQFEPELQGLAELGLIEISSERIFPTKHGIWFADEISVRLMNK